jgi:murein DD-endopeptidase MepM/ murein hydrolase activator NlpD
MTKAIFLTLQRGDQIACLRLRPPALALLAASLVCALTFLLRTDAPADPQTLDQAKHRIAALQSQLEQVTSQQALSADLINGRLQEAQKHLARLEGQSQLLAQINPHRPVTLRLRALEEAMERTERSQIRELTELAGSRRTEVTRIESALKDAGINLPQEREDDSATGGPFIPLDTALSGPFAQKYEEAVPLFARHATLQGHLPSLPLRAPFAGKIEISSSFGPRRDPFHGRAAWHSGLDLRSDSGADVLATAAGTVTASGWNGAYGQSLDIDHGNGLLTRYAHLSRIFVREGDQVAAEERIALSGASGRAKGAHLHYELRINGEPINPLRILKAGEKLGSLLKPVTRARELAQ